MRSALSLFVVCSLLVALSTFAQEPAPRNVAAVFETLRVVLDTSTNIKSYAISHGRLPNPSGQ